MTSYEFEVAAKKAIIASVKDRYEETFNIEDISVVWMTHVMGFKKGIFIDNGENSRMYEVTYNRDRDEMYVDMYVKDRNYVVKYIRNEVVYHG